MMSSENNKCVAEGNNKVQPGNEALVAMKQLQMDVVFKLPKAVGRKRPKTKVLDEDSYIEGMEKIIQRDYFPDLERLKAQNEYLDAVEKNDVIKIREMHLRYVTGKRPATERIASPATFETPQIHQEEPSYTPAPADLTSSSSSNNNEKSTNNISLDQYLSVHTSEDNESFNEIIIEAERKHRLKYAYLYNQEHDTNNRQLLLPSVEEQCALPEKKFNIDSWGYKNQNYIMYIPDGVEPTKEQIIEMNQRKQEIVYSNTRLSMNPFNEQQSKETITELAKSQAKVKDGRIGVDGKEVVSESPKIRGFTFVRTPSPCPVAMDSPLMTWGQIEGTPFMLDGSDTPLPRTAGTAFKIAEPPRRETLAFALAEKAGEIHRHQKQKAIQAARKQFITTPSPRPNTSSIDRLASMSPAARRLATSRLGISSSNDLGLRLSYSPSPKNRAHTPRKLSTPLATPSPRTAHNTTFNLTDNLLNISLPKRQKAADFF